jgi:deoxyribodipyrimidine photolyase-related protein
MRTRGVDCGPMPPKSKSEVLWIVLGNQLFDPSWYKQLGCQKVFMAEDFGLCTHYRYHKKKLVLFLAAMRHFAEDLRKQKIEVHYEGFKGAPSQAPYETKLQQFLAKHPVQSLHTFEIEDKFMEKRLADFCAKSGLSLVFHPSPMFLTPRDTFGEYLKQSKKPFMKTFYEGQRKKLGILVDNKGKPRGGKWSFDAENRAKLPKGIVLPALPTVPQSAALKEVMVWVSEHFADHPGQVSEFWLPYTRSQALDWLDAFFEARFHSFGLYEDAISRHHDFVFHSVLTPVLNLGLLTPAEIVEKALEFAQAKKVPLNSLEGFIRQIIGWREFIRGIYQNYSEKEEASNFWGHERGMPACWYTGDTGIAPLDCTIQRVVRLGYCHHIERLMVLSNLMLLCQIHPRKVHAWFMEMFVDSSDWVMGPNVYGMGQFSDGGIFATKPYICASNYILKMSDYSKGPWCQDVDALFWSFLNENEAFFAKNFRMNMLLKTFAKKTAAEKRKLIERADSLRARLTT